MEKKNNGKGLLIAIVLVLVIAIVAGVVYYMNTFAKASYVFTSNVEKTINNLACTQTAKTEDIKLTLTANLDAEGNAEYQQIADIISKIKIEVNSQRDYVKKTEYVELGLINDGQELIRGNAYYTEGESDIYVFVNDLFDKYFKISLKTLSSDENLEESITSILNKDEIDVSKVKDILVKKLKEKLIEDYFKQESVDGAKKTTLKMTFVQLKNIVKEICTELQKDDDFLKCFKDQAKVKKDLSSVVNGLNAENDTELEKMSFELSLYTKGLFANDVVKFEVTVTDGETTATITLNKVSKEKYELVLNVPEMGKITFNIEYSSVKNGALKNVDTSNSVDVNNLSEADMITIQNNLINMPIYSLLSSYLMMNSSSYYDDYDYDLDSDYNYDFNYDDYMDMYDDLED